MMSPIARALPRLAASSTPSSLISARRGLATTGVLLKKQPLSPTNDSRTSPRDASTPTHPGYTPADTPVSSEHPSAMPGVGAQIRTASTTPQASTRPHPPHAGIKEMAEGAKIGGEDGITPEERNVKNWGPNQRTPEFNPLEGKRRPVHDGGSNEGGFDSKGQSKT